MKAIIYLLVVWTLLTSSVAPDGNADFMMLLQHASDPVLEVLSHMHFMDACPPTGNVNGETLQENCLRLREHVRNYAASGANASSVALKASSVSLFAFSSPTQQEASTDTLFTGPANPEQWLGELYQTKVNYLFDLSKSLSRGLWLPTTLRGGPEVVHCIKAEAPSPSSDNVVDATVNFSATTKASEVKPPRKRRKGNDSPPALWLYCGSFTKGTTTTGLASAGAEIARVRKLGLLPRRIEPEDL